MSLERRLLGHRGIKEWLSLEAERDEEISYAKSAGGPFKVADSEQNWKRRKKDRKGEEIWTDCSLALSCIFSISSGEIEQ